MTAAWRLGVATVAIAAAVSPSAAHADVAGTLSTTPATGNQDTYAVFNTSGACPAGATNIQVTMTGPGISPADIATGSNNIVGNSNLSAYNDNPAGGKTIPATRTFREVVLDGGILPVPLGKYTLRAICRTASDSTPLGQFVGTVTFSPNAGDPLNKSDYTAVP